MKDPRITFRHGDKDKLDNLPSGINNAFGQSSGVLCSRELSGPHKNLTSVLQQWRNLRGGVLLLRGTAQLFVAEGNLYGFQSGNEVLVRSQVVQHNILNLLIPHNTLIAAISSVVARIQLLELDFKRTNTSRLHFGFTPAIRARYSFHYTLC